jgi:anti-sigma regulatory factor (Ser/Thr protein kinase)
MPPGSVSRRFTLRTLDEICDISLALAESFPNPEKVRIGIHELLINAIEHGNLGLGFEAKTALLREGKWEEEIERRLALPEYANRKVDVELSSDKNNCCLTIADEGKGFAWKNYFALLSRGERPNGRGLLLAYACGFDRFTFNALGNKVTCESKYL